MACGAGREHAAASGVIMLRRHHASPAWRTPGPGLTSPVLRQKGAPMTRSRTSGNTPSQRQLRVGELIRRTLAEILQRGETGDPELESVSITVSEVRISPDLRHATAYVMPLGGGNAAGVIKALNRNRAMIRRIVTQ